MVLVSTTHRPNISSCNVSVYHNSFTKDASLLAVYKISVDKERMYQRNNQENTNGWFFPFIHVGSKCWFDDIQRGFTWVSKTTWLSIKRSDRFLIIGQIYLSISSIGVTKIDLLLFYCIVTIISIQTR